MPIHDVAVGAVKQPVKTDKTCLIAYSKYSNNNQSNEPFIEAESLSKSNKHFEFLAVLKPVS